MRPVILVGSILWGVFGCQLPPEMSRSVPPLPSEAGAIGYRDVVQRARWQATMATEAFYVDRWSEVEAAAQGLEETARYLTRAREIPMSQESTLAVRSEKLAKEAQALRLAVQSRDEHKTTEVMQRINLLVRELRPE
jgi:hypothetical protein